MDNLKDTRWKQRFENFEKAFLILKKYSFQEQKSEIEEAGIIHFFEITFELSLNVIKDYLEGEGYQVISPRETIKQAYQTELISDGHIWMEGLSKRTLTTHTYDEAFAEKFVEEVKKVYVPAFDELYQTLKKE
ncbi:nucleotidyltransferase substrate binding protein [Halobacillus litoralis]|uniref:nucleotidyltransferase substrate binding protein n=1 Tax=Halobacillus litoralis TaxID=45668 RepID=UPI001CD1F55F|nr:nucleotidyltransferase substrate binding protein [Halobacillus litoralis]MCA0970507.1 nucleotidyltransferase substrate binding protein [Halobacillus litoralis]